MVGRAPGACLDPVAGRPGWRGLVAGRPERAGLPEREEPAAVVECPG